MERIRVSGPWITQKEIDYVTDAVANAWYGNASMYHERFEAAFAKYHGVQYAISLPSCTSAIHLSLLALGIGLGDEVIVPEITWIGTAAPVTYVGATTVFADIDEKTWCMSAESFEECITPRTRAVIPVDLYGGLPDWNALRTVAQRHGIAIIEDAAQAIGAEYQNKKAGSFGTTGVFSFHGSKTVTTGEGGMLLTNDSAINDRVLFLRDHGRSPGDVMFNNAEVAYKYKMSSLQAALGLAQIERVEELVSKKREIYAWYKEELSDLDGVTLNYEPPETRNTYWMVTVIVHPAYGLKKADIIRLMSERNIDCRPFFHPLSQIPAYAGSKQAMLAEERNRVSYAVSPYGVNLPSALNMTRESVAYVCSAFKAILLG